MADKLDGKDYIHTRPEGKEREIERERERDVAIVTSKL